MDYLELSNTPAGKWTQDKINDFYCLVDSDPRVSYCELAHIDENGRPIFEIKADLGNGELIESRRSAGSLAQLLHCPQWQAENNRQENKNIQNSLRSRASSTNTGSDKARTSLSDKALAYRDIAKMFGGKALSGTKRQKEWAEKIRAEKLAGMNQDQAELACRADGLGKSSKFWIENKERSPRQIGEFFVEQTELLAKAKSLRAQLNEAEYRKAAEQYNKLTEEWGFL